MAESVHLLKLCVGAESVEDLIDWHRTHPSPYPTGERRHVTRMWPKREAEVIAGGSLYWVIKGVIQVRQRLTGFGEGQKADGSPCCLLLLDPELVAVRPVPRRAFQGWRYLAAADAPADLTGQQDGEMAGMPEAMRRQLAELGLI